MTKIHNIKDKEPTWEELKKLVGGYIEVAFDDGKTQLICNEEGTVDGLPVNGEAMILWASLLGYPPTDFLVGDVVVLTGDALLT